MNTKCRPEIVNVQILSGVIFLSRKITTEGVSPRVAKVKNVLERRKFVKSKDSNGTSDFWKNTEVVYRDFPNVSNPFSNN